MKAWFGEGIIAGTHSGVKGKVKNATDNFKCLNIGDRMRGYSNNGGLVEEGEEENGLVL